jgi:hypothetical protein
VPAPVLILLVAASVILVAEFLLTAAAGLAAYQPGAERFAHLTGCTPNPVVYRLLGLIALLGVAGIILGAWWPPAAIVAGLYFAMVAGFTLLRQVQRGQRGSELLPYSLFLLSAAVVISVHLVFGAAVL